MAKNLTIGRVGLDVDVENIGSVQIDDAGVVKLRAATAPGSVANAVIISQQLSGYVDQSDEVFVPVTWVEFPDFDGYYRLLSASVTRPRETTPAGVFDLDLTLQRVLNYSSPLMELLVLGAVRATESQVLTNRFLNPTFDGAAAPVNDTNMTSLAIVSDGGNNVGKGQASSSAVAVMRLMPNTDRPAAAAGERWYAACSLKNPNLLDRSLRFGIVFYDTAGATLGTALATTYGASTVVGAGITSGFTVDAVAPASTASVALVAVRNAGTNAATSDLVYADNVYLSKDMPVIDIATNGFFSGASSSRSGYAFAWAGTTNASASTCTLTWTSTTAIPQAGLPADLESLQNVTVPGGVASTPAMKEFSTESAAVRAFEPPAGESVTEFRVAPADFYDAAATLLIGGHVAVGRQVVNDPDGWLLSNDRFQVRPVAGELAVEMRQYASGAWSDWQTVAFRMQPDSIDGVSWLGIAAFADPHAVTVLRNSPECVAIRLHSKLAFQTVSLPVSYYELTVSVDLLLRRGMPYAAVEMKASVPGKLGVAVEGFSAASPFNHGWFLASSSVFAASPQAIVIDGSTPAGVKTSSSLTSASFGIGFTGTPTSLVVSRWQYPHLHYQFATAERMRVVS